MDPLPPLAGEDDDEPPPPGLPPWDPPCVAVAFGDGAGAGLPNPTSVGAPSACPTLPLPPAACEHAATSPHIRAVASAAAARRNRTFMGGTVSAVVVGVDGLTRTRQSA